MKVEQQIICVGVVAEDWRRKKKRRYEGKGDKGNHIVISLLSVVGKQFISILVDKMCWVSERWLNKKQGKLRNGDKGYADNPFYT